MIARGNSEIWEVRMKMRQEIASIMTNDFYELLNDMSNDIRMLEPSG